MQRGPLMLGWRSYGDREGALARRGSPHDLQRIAARARRVRRPHQAGPARRAAWYGWRFLSTLMRPAVFAALVAAALGAGLAGLHHLNPGTAAPDREARISRAFAALAPDARSATALWSAHMDEATRPRRAGPPDTELALSLAHAFEDMAGRERYASFSWGEARGLGPDQTEAILRALPVWVRAQELERVWQYTFASATPLRTGPAAMQLAPESVQFRIARAERLYPVINQVSAGFFAGHESGALNISALPGMDVSGDLWVPADAAVIEHGCAQGDPLVCTLARLGAGGDWQGWRPASGQGARLMRAALAADMFTPDMVTALRQLEPGELESTARDLALTARHTSNLTAMRLTALLATPKDAARLRMVAETAGPRTLALFHLAGPGALELAGAVEAVPVMTRAAMEYFILSAVIAGLALGMVVSAIVSAGRVRRSRRAGLGQRLDIAARELLLGRKS